MSNPITLNRTHEINIIAFRIPNSDDIIIASNGINNWFVKTSDGIFQYNNNEMLEIYNVNMPSSDLERLTWTT